MGRVIEASDLRHRYPDGTVGVDGVSLSVSRGERVAVLGPNGSGKSTLLSLLGGLVDPDEGRIRYFESTTDPEAVRDRLGVLLQDPDDYLFNATVREDLAYGPAQLGMPRERADERIARLADELDLGGLLDRPPFRLSGGEKKRAALAATLAFDPDVLLLDEPVSNVDATYRHRILDLLDRLNEAGTTLVVATPDVELVSAVADRVCLVAADGTLATDGSTREVLTDGDLLERVGLRPPATVRLFEGRVAEANLPLDVPAARELLERER